MDDFRPHNDIAKSIAFTLMNDYKLYREYSFYGMTIHEMIAHDSIINILLPFTTYYRYNTNIIINNLLKKFQVNLIEERNNNE